MKTLSVKSCGLAAAAYGLFLSVPGSAQNTPQLETERPEIFRQLLDCRGIEDIEERVVCYDRQVDALDQAEANNDLIVADREEVREARKGLFGFKLPKVRLFGGDDGEDGVEDVKEVETAVVSARRIDRKRWRLALENGSVWEQTETRSFSRAPQSGDKVQIKRASLGSFLVKVRSNPWIRMRRVE